MEKEKINTIILQYKNLLPQDKIMLLKSTLEKADDNVYETILTTKIYNPTTPLILSIFLGGIGVDRFYIGDIGVGVCKLLFGFLTFGIWPLIDIFCSYKKAKAKNLNNLLSNINSN